MNSKPWVLLLACVAMSAASSGAAIWDDEVLITTPADGWDSNTTWYNNGYNIAVDPWYRVHAVWWDIRDGRWMIYYKRSTDGGLTWSGETRLTEPSGYSENFAPRICADAFGRVHVVYLHHDPENPDDNLIWYRRSTDGGATWWPAQAISGKPGAQPRDAVVAADGANRIHVAWTEDRSPGGPGQPGGVRQVYYRRSLNGGADWQPDIQISNIEPVPDHYIECNAPSMTTDLWDGVHVSWHDNRNDPLVGAPPPFQLQRHPVLWLNFEIFYQRSLDGGSAWLAVDKQLTNALEPSSGSCIAVDTKGWVHIAFHDERDNPPGTEIYYLRSTNQGTDWEQDRRLTYSDGLSGYPSIAADLLGRVHMTWEWVFQNPDQRELFYRLSPDGGSTWEDPYQLTSNTIHDDYASVAVDPVGGVHALWERWEEMGVSSEVFYRRARPNPILGSTEPSQGRHLIRDQWTGNLHLVFHSNDNKIYYTQSWDNGYTWAVPQYLDEGKYPTLCLVPTMMMSTVVCVAYKPTYDDCSLMYQFYDPMIGVWQKVPIGTSWYPGPPAMVTDGYTNYVIYRASSWKQQSWYLFCNVFPYFDPSNAVIDNVDYYGDPEQPCVAMDAEGNLHAAWRRAAEDEIYYGKRNANGQWYPELVRQSSGFVSTHPFVECCGDQVYVAWSDGDGYGSNTPSDAWRANRYLSGGPWDYRDVSFIPGSSPASESPTQAGQEFTTWSEGAGAASFDINYWSPVWGWGVVEPTAVCSYWPHSQMNYGFWGPNLWSAWTESPGPNQPPYCILTKMNSWGFIGGEGGAYYSASAGGSEPSRYCQKRDGVLRYGEKAVDYANDSLVYELPYLDPNYDYYLKVASYRETGNTWTQAISLDGYLARSVQFLPNRVDTAWLRIPPETYIRDRKVKFALKNVRGDYVTSLGLTLYQRDPKTRGKGGGQAGEAVSLPAREVFAVYPNPMKDQAQFEYSLKVPGKVNLSVYNIMGRLVRIVVNGKQPAGVHRVSWDGKSQAGLCVPGGVYLVKLNAPGVNKTTKLIMVR